MNDLSHQQLLRDYVECGSEAAFAELVRRHIDFVYSAAVRILRDPHLAQDVTQNVFLAVAQNARQLTNRPVLTGWLHRTVRNLSANAIRSEVRRRTREQEAATMHPPHGSNPLWDEIAPYLDAALGELNESDRDAVLLRYFEHKSAREMAQVFRISDEAAQKRVTRAVERLRQFLAKHGIVAGANGLVVLIAANAVQAAPAGLAATISTATIAGAALSTTITATAPQAIVMTTLQKAVVATVLTAAIGTGVYEGAQNAKLRGQVQTLQQQQTPLVQQVQQLQQERDDARQALEAAQSTQGGTELLQLRGEVARLRDAASRGLRAEAELAQLKSTGSRSGFTTAALDANSSSNALFTYLGEPVPAPANMHPAYTKEGLLGAIDQAAQLLGVSLAKVEIDSSEFPFLVGVVSDTGGIDKLVAQLKTMPAYEYRGAAGGDKVCAFNITPYDKLAPEAFQRTHRRTMLRTQMLYDQIRAR